MSSVLPDSEDSINALERIRVSRERLRDALRTSSSTGGASMRQRDSSNPDGTGGSSGLLDALKSIPGTTILIDALASWWAQHPLHAASLLAASAAKVIIKPMADRKPWTLMFGMVIIGGLLAWKRPWRRLLTPALLVGLVPHLISQIGKQMPLESWLDSFDSKPDQAREKS